MKIYAFSLLSLILVALFFLFFKKNSFSKEIKIDLGLGSVIYAGIIAIYSLILAFVVIVAWQEYQATGDRIETEASKLYNVYRSTYAFSDTNKVAAKKLRVHIDSYVVSVSRDEWPLMKKGSSSAYTQGYNDSILRDLNHVNPVTEKEKVWYEAAVHNMFQFCEARHSRLEDKDFRIPPYMWWMLILGALVIIGFSMFLESKNDNHHFINVLLISFMIVFSLLLVYLLEHPFQGFMALRPAAFEKITLGNW